MQAQAEELARAVAAGDLARVAPPPDSRVLAEVKAELERRRPLFIKQCWEPALKQNPLPNTATFTFSLAFNAQGKEIGRGLQVQHPESAGAFQPGSVAAAKARSEAVRADVGNCLSQLGDKPIEIHGTGQTFSVTVPMSFP